MAVDAVPADVRTEPLKGDAAVPAVRATHRTRFFDHKIPSLYAGRYEITTRQTVAGQPTEAALPEQRRRFEVRGARFVIEGTEVHACYPIPGGVGVYSQLLPHITLDTPGLPWNRPLAGQPAPVPWMALCVFREGELPDDPDAIGHVDRCTVDELRAGALTGRPPAITPESLFPDEHDLTCQSILVPAALFRAVAPTPTEMGLLAHIREGGPPDAQRGSDPPPDESALNAVVVANRFPSRQAGMHVAHLLSLDGHEAYLNGQAPPQEGLRVVSLWSWVFETLEDTTIGFGDLVHYLATEGGEVDSPHVPDLLLRRRYDAPASPDPGQRDVARVLDGGGTALPQRLESGERTVAFYRGPLTAEPAPALPAPERARLDSAGEALIYHQRAGVFDTSYAAAFTLGRTLALADAEFRAHLLGYRKAARSAARRLLTHPRLAGRAARDAAAVLGVNLPRRAFDQLLVDGDGIRVRRAMAGAGAAVAAGRRRPPGRPPPRAPPAPPVAGHAPPP
ncbi:hypothetical protein I7412_18320, partial [Frankia sp. CN6]|nr:hypothetical protein [Frankia nepalensis]